MNARDRFVCVINRNRDSYQVPLALAEAGLLEQFVTDFYASPRWHRMLPGVLRRRWAPGLPSAQVARSWLAFVVQTAADRLKLPMKDILPHTDRMLAHHGAVLARRSGASLYCYSSYLPSVGQIPAGTRVIDFEYHPHQHHVLEILAADAAIYPEVAESFALERSVLEREKVTTAWTRADAIVCASAMTRRSLEHAGCDPARITVIPYGFADTRTDVSPRPAGKCEFLFVGQGIQRKGIHHLIRAWQQVRPDNARLTLACYHIDPAIAALVNDPSIRLLGRRTREELDALYAASDVFVMPSLVEGFGLVYLEALERGCHLVGTGNTGLPDLPLDGDAATLVPAGDLAKLGATLLQLAQRKADGGFDPAAIAAQASAWPWARFRAAIADHAQDVLAAPPRTAAG